MRNSLSLLTLLIVVVGNPMMAIERVTGGESAGPISEPILRVEPSTLKLQANSPLADGIQAFAEFRARYGGRWEVDWDVRSDRAHLVQGSGIPLWPGQGNRLSVEISGRSKAPNLGEIEGWLRTFMETNGSLLKTEGIDLILDEEKSMAYGYEAYLWTVEFKQKYHGLPVHDTSVFFRINHGNVIQFGTRRVAEIRLPSEPNLSAESAFRAALDASELDASLVKRLGESRLKVFPALPSASRLGEKWKGTLGRGYAHHLAWETEFTYGGEPHVYFVRVDAHGGQVLEWGSRSRTSDATVMGQILPSTVGDTLVSVPLPFTAVDNGVPKVTDANGVYDYTGGLATANLDGQYISINDNCGAISLTDDTDGNINFSGAPGTDCTTPGSGGAGNTNAARSGFYHLTNINRKAKSFLPGNAWLDSKLTANMNINDACNAFWDGSTVNFYRHGTSGTTECNNTGEIAAVFLHEWGHGMDDNSGGPAGENGSGEALGDTFAFLEQRDGCIGDEFFANGTPCTNCNADCSGVRDVAAFATGGVSTLATPASVEDDAGINCDAFDCPYYIFGIPLPIFAYQGPMGYEGHCESYIASSANWDLTQLLVAEYGEDGGYDLMDTLWYGSLTPAGSAYQVTAGGQCNTGASIDGCGADNWYTVLLAVDDDDGDLGNGTPNGCRIWEAFNAHGIACGAQPTCTSGGSDDIFADGFESGDTSAWSATQG